MAHYMHDVDGQLFVIDVFPVILPGEIAGQFFEAHIGRLGPTGLVPVANGLGRNEVYGPTEAWAVRNARDLLDAGASRSTAQIGMEHVGSTS